MSRMPKFTGRREDGVVGLRRRPDMNLQDGGRKGGLVHSRYKPIRAAKSTDNNLLTSDTNQNPRRRPRKTEF